MYSTDSNGKLSFRRLALASCLLVALMVAFVVAVDDERLRIENRKPKDNGQDLAETINYLEGVDKYYSQLSRPRFGRSEYKQTVMSLADRLAGYRGASHEPSPQNTRWGLESPAYPINNGQGHYTLSLSDLIRRRLAEQSALYDQNNVY